MNSITYCMVKNCRFPYSHTTKGHFCGKCNQYGHGILECGNIQKIRKLEEDRSILPTNVQCSHNCRYKKYHMTHAHHCNKCKKRHYETDCIIQEFSIHDNRFSISNDNNFDINKFIHHGTNSYINIYVGMGCCVYLTNRNGAINSLFLHSDNHGQYSEDTNDVPMMEKFINGLPETDINLYLNGNVNSNPNFQCPVCRTSDVKSNVFEIKGAEEICKICLQNKVEIYFPNCKHIVTCKECFSKL